MDKHKNKQQLVSIGTQRARLQSFREEVEWLELRAKRDALQQKLTGFAIEERIDAFLDIQMKIEATHPELLPVLIETVKDFLRQVNVDEKVYFENLEKDRNARLEAQQKVKNPSEQLHAIKEQIQSQKDTLIDKMNEEPHGDQVELQTPENTAEVLEKPEEDLPL